MCDLEQAIIDRLEAFLLDMGKGFCFVARQRRITLEGDHFYVDLVFCNRLLRCLVLVDLKLGKLTHQDLGQIQMYVNHFDRFQRAEHEEPTIGLVLCSDKNDDAMVKITLPEAIGRSTPRRINSICRPRTSCAPSWLENVMKPSAFSPAPRTIHPIEVVTIPAVIRSVSAT